MKNVFLTNIIILVLIFNALSCKAQQEYPINTMPMNISNDSYIRDYNNELDPFTGVFKTFYADKEITLDISKNVKKRFTRNGLTVSHYYKDALIIKFLIKDSSGSILQNTLNSTDEERHFISNTIVLTSKNIVKFYYTGADCGIGWGNIEIKKINSNQISWSYYPNSTSLNSINCPNPINTKVYLPETENLVFTKQ